MDPEKPGHLCVSQATPRSGAWRVWKLLVERSQRPSRGARMPGLASPWLLKEHRASQVNAADRSLPEALLRALRPARPCKARGWAGGLGGARGTEENRSLKLGVGRVVQMAATRGSSARGRWWWGGGSVVGGGRWRLASGSVARCFLLPGPTPPRLVFLRGRETTGAHKAPDSPARPQGDWLPGPLHTDCRGRAGGAQSGPISQPVPVKTEGGDREAKPFIKL